MSINALNSNQNYGLYDIFGVNSANAVSGVSAYGSGTGSDTQKTTTSSGDTVDISAEARALFSRKLQMLRTEDEQTEQVLKMGAGQEKPAVDNGITDADREAAGATGSGESSAVAGGAGGSGGVAGAGGGSGMEGSEDEDRQKELESQLKELQSQLLGIMSGPGEPDDKMQKAGPVENRIRSVEAELQAMKKQTAGKAKG